jgi:hypothetical protein
MSATGRRQRIQVGGRPGLSMRFDNESPLGFRETNWLVTVLRPDGRLQYFLGVAPQNQFSRYKNTFDTVISSVRFS